MPLRVLIVDDNRDAADSLALVFDLVGASARVAYLGADALRVFDEFRPHVGVLDVDMPGMSGLDLAREARRRQAGPLPLVALTGLGTSDATTRTTAAGFDLHVTKPGLPADLVRRAKEFHRAHCPGDR